MWYSFVATHSGLSLTSYQWCSPKQWTSEYLYIFYWLLLCCHWLPATAVEKPLLFQWWTSWPERLVKPWGWILQPYMQLVSWALTYQTHCWAKRAGRERSARGDRRRKRKIKDGCMPFSEIPRAERLAHGATYVECAWRRHLVVSHV